MKKIQPLVQLFQKYRFKKVIVRVLPVNELVVYKKKRRIQLISATESPKLTLPLNFGYLCKGTLMREYRQLTEEDRIEIYAMKQAGKKTKWYRIETWRKSRYSLQGIRA